jgi:ribosome-binding ATPase YchF (GTP1/OBG family)
VDVLARPTKIFSKDEEERLAARAEREAKRAAKAALEVIDPDTGKTLFKTERGATNEIASRLDAYFSYDSQEYLDKAAKIVKAVAFKRGVKPEDLLAELKGKAEKKFRREAVKQIKYMLKPKGFPGWQDKSDPALWYDSYRRVATEEGLI